MTVSSVSIVVERDLMEKLQAFKDIEGVEIGNSISTDSLSDAADSPIGPDEIRVACEIATIIFNTGAAGIIFLDRLLQLLKTYKGKNVEFVDPKSGKRIGNINGDTQTDQARKMLGL